MHTNSNFEHTPQRRKPTRGDNRKLWKRERDSQRKAGQARKRAFLNS